MGHVPNIGNFLRREHAVGDAGGPTAEVLGTVKESITDPAPTREGATWTRESGETVEFVAPPAPWEINPERGEGDARSFVDVPNEWTLRWINPKLLDQFGWRYWQPVMASDPRVKVKVPSVVAATNNIRRGGETGDILAWMYTEWVEKRRKQLAEDTLRLTGTVRSKQEQLIEEGKRGAFGPYVRFVDPRTPTNTVGDGRTMEKD